MGGGGEEEEGREKGVLEGNPRAALHCSGVEAGEEDCPHSWPGAGQTGPSCEGGWMVEGNCEQTTGSTVKCGGIIVMTLKKHVKSEGW